jgi:hypothetical protein
MEPRIQCQDHLRRYVASTGLVVVIVLVVGRYPGVADEIRNLFGFRLCLDCAMIELAREDLICRAPQIVFVPEEGGIRNQW